MGTGYLLIQVRTGDDALPIDNAHVTLLDRQGRILYETYTDANGNTEPLSLPAPDAQYTLDPYYGKPAYSEWDVDVEKQGYIISHIHDVQIIDTQTSILPVKLEPLADEPFPETDMDIFIPPEGLLLPDSSQVGPAQDMAATRQAHPNHAVTEESPPATGTVRVLQTQTAPQRQVIIPDYITVHLGIPSNAAARNVRVKFVDYIKNVVSADVCQGCFSR